jgi:hypothetical protein
VGFTGTLTDFWKDYILIDDSPVEVGILCIVQYNKMIIENLVPNLLAANHHLGFTVGCWKE